MAFQIESPITAADYYQLPEYTQHDFIQLIDGEVFIAMPPIPAHQTVVGNIHVMLWTLAKQQNGKAYIAPIEVYLDSENIYQPDVLYLSPNTRCVVEEKRLVGAPDLVVEVLSPSTAKLDREKKFAVYESHGVQEYWIADPVNLYLEVWQLENGKFIKLGTFIPGDTFTSSVLGVFLVQVADIFEGL